MSNFFENFHLNLKLLKIQFLIAFITPLSLSSCCDILCKREKNAALIIQATEEYFKENNRLPKDFLELGMPIFEDEADEAYYRLINDSIYEVWYGTSLGCSKIFNSETKEWREEG